MKKVLIVDDEEDIVELLVDLLGEIDQLDFYTALDGEAAWRQCEKERPDLIISDIKMPRKDGVWFLKKVRVQYPTLPVIVISGFTDLDLEEMNRLRVQELFHKPFEVLDLMLSVERLLGIGESSH